MYLGVQQPGGASTAFTLLSSKCAKARQMRAYRVVVLHKSLGPDWLPMTPI